MFQGLIELIETSPSLRVLNVESNFLTPELLAKLLRSTLVTQSIVEFKADNQVIPFSSMITTKLAPALFHTFSKTKNHLETSFLHVHSWHSMCLNWLDFLLPVTMSHSYCSCAHWAHRQIDLLFLELFFFCLFTVSDVSVLFFVCLLVPRKPSLRFLHVSSELKIQ